MDIYAEITNRIIAALESGKIPWERPWRRAADLAIKRTTGEPYSLLNQILLGEPGEYMTFDQCRKEGGRIRKGAKAKVVVFWKFIQCPQKDEDGNILTDSKGRNITKSVPLLKYFNVFHIDDCEGLEPKHYSEELIDFDPIEKAEDVLNDYVARSGIALEHRKQSRAYYSPSSDKIVLPLKEQFKGSTLYYGTAFHEATHSTGHPSRLNRLDGSIAAFGDESYSKEELVAEIGSATILSMLGLETANTFRNTAAYIQGWLKALKNDKHLIVSAAGKAEKAVNLIMNKRSEQGAAGQKPTPLAFTPLVRGHFDHLLTTTDSILYAFHYLMCRLKPPKAEDQHTKTGIGKAHISGNHPENGLFSVGLGERIRTSGLLNPIQTSDIA